MTKQQQQQCGDNEMVQVSDEHICRSVEADDNDGDDDGWSIGLYDNQDSCDCDDDDNNNKGTMTSVQVATADAISSMSHDINHERVDANDNNNDCIKINNEVLNISQLRIGRLLTTNRMIHTSINSRSNDKHDDSNDDDILDTRQSQNRMDPPSRAVNVNVDVDYDIYDSIIQTSKNAESLLEDQSTTGNQYTPRMCVSNSFYYSVGSRTSSCRSLTNDINDLNSTTTTIIGHHTGSIADLLSFYDTTHSSTTGRNESFLIASSPLQDQSQQQQHFYFTENEVNTMSMNHEVESREQQQQTKHCPEDSIGSTSPTSSIIAKTAAQKTKELTDTSSSSSSNSPKTSLHHDLLMNILSYLDLDSLNSFSETGRRPNGECYYFIRLQLQHILRLANSALSTTTSDSDSSSSSSNNDNLMNGLPDLHYLYRFAVLDIERTETMIQTLYYDLPYQQSTFRRNRYYNHNTAKMAAAAAAGSAAFVMACMGMAAAYGAHTSSSATSSFSSNPIFSPSPTMVPSTTNTAEEWDEYAAAMTAFMKVVGVFGSIAAAKTMATVSSLSTTATTTPVGSSGNTTTNNNSNESSSKSASSKNNDKKDRHVRWNFSRNKEVSSTSCSTSLMEDFPLLLNDVHHYPDPYQHHAQETTKGISETSSIQEEQHEGKLNTMVQSNLDEHIINNKDFASSLLDNKNIDTDDKASKENNTTNSHQFYVGSVGAYRRLVKAAKREITTLIRQQRRHSYNSILDEDEKRTIFTTFMLAIIANDLPLVKRYINTIDIDIAYPIQLGLGNNNGGNDNVITMLPVHAAAFYGADQVLDFLCQGIDLNPQLKPEQEKKKKFKSTTISRSNNKLIFNYTDGGLVSNINQQDPTGWTLLHFATGANNTNAVQMLLYKYNADPSIEADNGYTPYQWARRLQHNDVMIVFQSYYTQQHHDTFTNILRRHIF